MAPVSLVYQPSQRHIANPYAHLHALGAMYPGARRRRAEAPTALFYGVGAPNGRDRLYG